MFLLTLVMLAMRIILPIAKSRKHDDLAFDYATCIGCGACNVATCKNASATLFVAAKVSQLALLASQGEPERETRAFLRMVLN